MVKGGGVAEALLPDLMVVAKTSKVDSIKNGLKKLLKAKLSSDAQKILSDKTNMRLYSESIFNHYHSLDPEFDVAQMAYTFVQREGKDPKIFLNTINSSENQFREEVFLGYYKKYTEKPHYLTIREKLTSDEMQIVLSMPEFKGLLKRLIIYADADVSGYIDALLLHKDTLQELDFTTTSSKLIDEIGLFKKIKRLSINGQKLEKLTEELLQMKKLKELRIYNNQPIIEDGKFNELNKMERFYCSGGFKIQE
jgi:actin-related protein